MQQLTQVLVDKLEDINTVVELTVIEDLIADTSIDFLPSLIEVFEAEIDNRIQIMTSNISNNVFMYLFVEAKSLHGTSSTFGAKSLMHLSKKMMQYAEALQQQELSADDYEAICQTMESIKEQASIAVNALSRLNRLVTQ